MMTENKIDRKNVEEMMGLTSMQEGMLFHYLANPNSKQYFEQIQLSLSGKIDLPTIKKTWRILAGNNEILRAVIRWEKLEEPVQIVLKQKEIPLHLIELPAGESQHAGEALESVIRKDRDVPIELNREPFRVTVCRIDDSHGLLIMTFHHILLDGWSTGILLQEFLETYNRLLAGEPCPPVTKTRYKDFFKWYQHTQTHFSGERREFWQKHLEGFDTRTLLPYNDNKLQDIQQVATYQKTIPPSLKQQLESCAQRHNVTLSTILYAAWGILLQKYNNSDDVIFGTTVSGRTPEVKGIEQIVGLFINTLPLRLNSHKDTPLAQLFQNLGKHLKDRSDHGSEHSSLTEIKQLSGIGKDSNLFDSIIVIDNYPLDNMISRGEAPDRLKIHSYQTFEMTNFDLTVQIMMLEAGDMRVDLHYNSDLFDTATLQRLAGHYAVILQGIGRDSAVTIAEVPLLSPEEKKQVLEEFNNPGIQWVVDKTIHGIIEAQAARHPNNKAVQYEDNWLTYSEFNQRANRLANFLAEQGVRAGTDARVAMIFPRSLDMIVALLGILKAGASCIPLDISYPEERNGFIIRDSEAKLLLVKTPGVIDTGKTSTVKEVVYEPGKLENSPADNPGNAIAPGDLSYIIYTSGSTGNPKGALLHHSGIVNHTYTKINVLGITAGDTVANNFSINVIASVWQILAPLFVGARLVVYSDEIEWDPYRQFEQVEADGVTVIEVIPSVLKAFLFLLEEGKEKIPLRGLRKIALTSEETKPILVNQFYKTYTHIDMVDCYGQTECCDDVLHYTIPHDTETVNVPIGYPSLNTRVSVLNHHDQLQPVGVPGEICVLSAGVAYGYWKRPELNAEKFTISPAARESLFEAGKYELPPAPGADFPESYCLDRFYRTGDLGRWQPDGKVEYLGRIDHQVKIRGNRVELREIENHLLRFPAIKEAAVVAREDREGDKNLFAFFSQHEEITTPEIRQFLLKTLPDYMVPAHFIPMDTLPLTPNGKIDRKALLKIEITGGTATGITYTPPRNEIEQKIQTIWTQLLTTDEPGKPIGIDDNFFDLGGHSLLLIKLKSKLEKQFDLKQEIGIIELFNYPTIAHQAQYILDHNQSAPTSAAESSCGGSGEPRGAASLERVFSKRAPLETDRDIAVIGISLRIPGADGIAEFWQNLITGTESISFFTEEEIEGSKVEDYIKGSLKLVSAGGIIGGIEYFDADFFGFNPREAEIIEPQQRLFLEHAWHALEDAGYGAIGETGGATVGVYAGVGLNTYLLNNIMAHPGIVSTLGEFQTMIGNDKDFLATRVAYKLNLKGPAITLQTACSTSLVAIHLARQGLLNGDCDMALVGGVAVHIPEKAGYFYNEGGYLSPDGHCRSFDARAEGTVFGNGVGVVVLKPRPEALRDNDYIYAILKGTAINNDGSMKVGYTSPSETGQANVIAKALNEAGVHPETIGYIETHGTGTVLGDPVEMAALKRAYRETAAPGNLKNQYCAIGSVKANVGHLDIAAGITGFIKTVLCLHHRQIPPSINMTEPNPMVDFPNTPFYVNSRLADWPQPSGGNPRRAGVSSFGIGGTNAHVILEENPVKSSAGAEDTKNPGMVPGMVETASKLILLSARSEDALRQMARNLATHLKENPALHLSDTAYTLTMGRKAFAHRLTLVSRDSADAAAALDEFNPKRLLMNTRLPGDKSVVFMFSGVGEHYVNMAYELYHREPVFKHYIDRCCDILLPILETDIRQILFVEKLKKQPLEGSTETDKNKQSSIDLRKLLNREEKPLSEEERVLSRTIYSQTSVFMVEYAMAQLLLSWGIKPYAMIGYSIGEYTAACLAGVFTLEDALFLVANRAKLLDAVETGAMLAISLPEPEVRQKIALVNSAPELPKRLSIAAVNTPDLCIVSGNPEGIDILEQQLQKEKAVFRRLKTFQAFHSHIMEAARDELTAVFGKVKLQAPAIPYISNVTGTWVKAEDIIDPGYWVAHTVSPIRFSEGITQLLKTTCNFFLEIGPGNSLCGFVAQHHHAAKEVVPDRFVLATLPKESENISSTGFLARVLGKLWAAGLEIRWDAFYKNRHSHVKRIPLPTYPFERKKYWLEAPQGPQGDAQTQQAGEPARASAAHVRIAKKENISDWFYVPYWKQSLAPLQAAPVETNENNEHWVLFQDETNLSQRLIQELKPPQKPSRISLVKIGSHYSKQIEAGHVTYTINPGQFSDYLELLGDIREQGESIDRILHFWQCPANGQTVEILERGVYSLLYLAKAMGKLSMFDSTEIWMVSRGLHQVETGDDINPAKAAILGPIKVVPQEYSNLVCRTIDFPAKVGGDEDERHVVNRILTELRNAPSHPHIAYRGGNRWVQHVEPVKVEKGPDVPVRLRKNGVYMITGGLGNIGYSISQYLAEAVQARLVLTTRSPYPARESSHPTVMKVNELEKMGARVLVVQADVADKDRMRQVIKQAEETFGPIHGVLHAAGIMEDRAFKLIADADKESCELHFNAKIHGLQVLEEVLRERELDFCLLTSSLSPLLGGLSLFAYSAANSFMDAFAHRQALVSGKNWLSINWADWQRGEPTSETCANLVLGSTVAQLNITPEEGKETFKRVLSLFTHSTNIPEIVISSGDMLRRLRQWVMTDQDREDSRENETSSPTGSQVVHQRPRLQSLYEAPQNEAEKIVVEIWQQLLGIDMVGVHDNFFELGGHSLIATKLISRLREIFRIDIPLPTLFDRPTVREVVENIIQTWGDGETVAEIAKTYREVYS